MLDLIQKLPSKARTSTKYAKRNVFNGFRIQQGFIQEKATVSFSVNSVFNSRRFKKTTYNPNRANLSTISDLDFLWKERSFTLNFNYRFNQNKKQGRPRRNFRGDSGRGY